MTDFYAALKNGNMPTVSFLKAPAYQDGHAGYSDPLDEQEFVTQVVNTVSNAPEWKDTAIIVLYDDSDGWYDHAPCRRVNPSKLGVKGYDVLSGDQLQHRHPAAGRHRPAGPRPVRLRHSSAAAWSSRPIPKVNFVDHTLTDQTSVMRFIEDNWMGGEAPQRRLLRCHLRFAEQHVRLVEG